MHDAQEWYSAYRQSWPCKKAESPFAFWIQWGMRAIEDLLEKGAGRSLSACSFLISFKYFFGGYHFSHPVTSYDAEDLCQGRSFWNLPQATKIKADQSILRGWNERSVHFTKCQLESCRFSSCELQRSEGRLCWELSGRLGWRLDGLFWGATIFPVKHSAAFLYFHMLAHACILEFLFILVPGLQPFGQLAVHVAWLNSVYVVFILNGCGWFCSQLFCGNEACSKKILNPLLCFRY